MADDDWIDRVRRADASDEAQLQAYLRRRDRGEKIGRRPGGRLNHKAKADYCGGLAPQLSDEMALATIAPKSEAEEAEITAEIYRIAALVRKARFPATDTTEPR